QRGESKKWGSLSQRVEEFLRQKKKRISGASNELHLVGASCGKKECLATSCPANSTGELWPKAALRWWRISRKIGHWLRGRRTQAGPLTLGGIAGMARGWLGQPV